VTIGEAPFVFVDTETTGLGEDAQLLEVAAHAIQGERAFETLVRPTIPIPADASGIHHIVDADVVDAPDRAEALDALLTFFAGDVLLIAHNAEFDRAQLTPELDGRRWLCSERLAHHLVPDAPNFKNSTLYYYLGGTKIVADLHRAAADIAVTRFVFERLIERYRTWAKEKCNAEQLARSEDVSSLLAFIERPYVMARPPFGKYKTWDALLGDAGYLRWMTGLPDLSTDLRWNIERQQRLRGRAA
jgi:exodeoxyribonuclease X